MGSAGLGQYGQNLNAFGKFSCKHFTSFGSLTTQCTLCNVSVGRNSNNSNNHYSSNNYSSNSRYSTGNNFSHTSSSGPKQSSSNLGLNINGTSIDLSQLVQLIKKELTAPAAQSEGSGPKLSVLDSVRKQLPMLTPTKQIQESVTMDSVATNSYFEQLNSEKNSSNPESSTEDSTSQTAAKTELTRLLNTYLSGNENFYDISSEDGKRSRDEDEQDLTLVLSKLWKIAHNSLLLSVRAPVPSLVLPMRPLNILSRLTLPRRRCPACQKLVCSLPSWLGNSTRLTNLSFQPWN